MRYAPFGVCADPFPEAILDNAETTEGTDVAEVSASRGEGVSK